ncbi:MAG: dihydrofolate reductase family protein [Chloroflexota bacterium]
MSLKSSVFIATSLDGYIARPDGDIEWLENASTEFPEGEDGGYSEFIKTIDYIVMGRKSYEKVLSFDIPWPYEKPVIVLSRNSIAFPTELPKSVTWSKESPQELTSRLSQEGAERLYIDGGITIQRFLSAGLIDDMTITLIPVILGAGISLFGEAEKDIPLKLVSSNASDFGIVQLTYEVENTYVQR